MLIEPEKRVMSTCDELFEETLCLTESLVRAYSTLGNEQKALEVMEAWYRQEGFTVKRVPMEASVLQIDQVEPSPIPARYNVMGMLNPESKGPHLVYNGHLDVVPAEPESLWTRPPWEPWRDGGWLYGRGAGDMQAGIAAMAMAVQAVPQAGLAIDSPLTPQSSFGAAC